jgi:hypothetical protein
MQTDVRKNHSDHADNLDWLESECGKNPNFAEHLLMSGVLTSSPQQRSID